MQIWYTIIKQKLSYIMLEYFNIVKNYAFIKNVSFIPYRYNTSRSFVVTDIYYLLKNRNEINTQTPGWNIVSWMMIVHGEDTLDNSVMASVDVAVLIFATRWRLTDQNWSILSRYIFVLPKCSVAYFRGPFPLVDWLPCTRHTI